MSIGTTIVKKRKALGLTQQNLADQLHISFQAVSKWENGTANPEIELLPQLARVLQTSVDSLLGYRTAMLSDYEERYQEEGYYWGIIPNQMCFNIMDIKPPVKPLKVLDIGCGEGKDAVFLARNGYQVSAMDISQSGLDKGMRLAEQNRTYVNFFKADITDYRLTEDYDIIFSSGVFHYIIPQIRQELIENLQKHTRKNGLNAINVFLDKPYVKTPPDLTEQESNRFPWKTGELFTYYWDWYMHRSEEILFDCNSGGIPHQHCMNIMVAERDFNS